VKQFIEKQDKNIKNNKKYQKIYEIFKNID
jgi:Na+-transporting NADH:ubiquinone oxidoreductase subunit NqrB